MFKQFVFAAASAFVVASTPAAAAAATFNVGPQTYSYSGLARGYFFTAPKSFTITSIFVADEASQANQWAQVVRLNSAPTLYPAVTNDFSSLGYYANQNASSAIATSIRVNTGEIIGILGTRGVDSVNSYGEGPFNSTIDGLPVTLQRLGFQDTLNNGPASGLFTEVGGAYGRVNFTFGGVPEPATWGLMILGFGAVGGAMRRRQSTAAKVRFA